MKETDFDYIKKVTDDDILEAYQDIININKKSHADFTLGIILSAINKCENIYYKDKWHVLINFIAYKYHSFLDESCKDEDLDDAFKNIKAFLKQFRSMLKEFKDIIYSNTYKPEEVAELYLYYFTLLTIHNRIIVTFDKELEKASLKTLDFSVDFPIEKSMEENIKDYDGVFKIVRELKKGDN